MVKKKIIFTWLAFIVVLILSLASLGYDLKVVRGGYNLNSYPYYYSNQDYARNIAENLQKDNESRVFNVLEWPMDEGVTVIENGKKRISNGKENAYIIIYRKRVLFEKYSKMFYTDYNPRVIPTPAILFEIPVVFLGLMLVFFFIGYNKKWILRINILALIMILIEFFNHYIVSNSIPLKLTPWYTSIYIVWTLGMFTGIKINQKYGAPKVSIIKKIKNN